MGAKHKEPNVMVDGNEIEGPNYTPEDLLDLEFNCITIQARLGAVEKLLVSVLPHLGLQTDEPIRVALDRMEFERLDDLIVPLIADNNPQRAAFLKHRLETYRQNRKSHGEKPT
jgi:hypothetical protein